MNCLLSPRIALAVAIALLLAGCAKKKRMPPVAAAPHAETESVHVGDEEVGVASWYGHPYHGRASSSGEIYDMEKLTAAHRTLPFGAVVRVKNLGNDQEVDVRINDRGPFVGNRIIDLSRAAARQIRMLGPGTANVRLTVMALPTQIEEGYFAVQVGAFRERANAERHRKDMEERYGPARVVERVGNPPLWRVLVGHETGLDRATALAERIKAAGGPAFVVRVDGPETD